MKDENNKYTTNLPLHLLSKNDVHFRDGSKTRITAILTLHLLSKNDIGLAPITQLRTCVIKIVTFKGGHLM